MTAGRTNHTAFAAFAAFAAPAPKPSDSTGAMAAAWFGTPGTEKAVNAVFGPRGAQPAQSAQGEPVAWNVMQKLRDEVMDFRHTRDGMVRGGDYVRLADLLTAAERIDASAPSTPPPQPSAQGEPVAWRMRKNKDCPWYLWTSKPMPLNQEEATWEAQPLYASAPSAPPHAVVEAVPPLSDAEVKHIIRTTPMGGSSRERDTNLVRAAFDVGVTAAPPGVAGGALMRGARVEGETVVISVKGGNDAARKLCGELVEMIERWRV